MSPAAAIDTNSARICLREDGIIYAEMRANIKQTVSDARENNAAYGVLSPRGRKPLLVDMRGMNAGIDRDARLFYASSATAEHVSAVALVVGLATSRVIGNFFTSVTRPAMPLRLFSNDAEAVEWLHKHAE